MKFSQLMICILLIWLTACSNDNTQPEQIVTDVSIQVDVEPSPPAVGEATLRISLTNDDGSPIDGATVSVHGDMDHEGMIPVDAESNTSVDGEYLVSLAWSMGGGWIIDVTAYLPDERGVAKGQFEFFVDAIPADSIINQTTAKEYTITIPEGTGDLIEAGNDPNIIPAEIVLNLDEYPILVIHNYDTVDHSVGPFFIQAGETIRQRFSQPAIYDGACSIHQGANVRIIVEESE